MGPWPEASLGGVRTAPGETISGGNTRYLYFTMSIDFDLGVNKITEPMIVKHISLRHRVPPCKHLVHVKHM